MDQKINFNVQDETSNNYKISCYAHSSMDEVFQSISEKTGNRKEEIILANSTKAYQYSEVAENKVADMNIKQGSKITALKKQHRGCIFAFR